MAIVEGSVCVVELNGRQAYLVARGSPSADNCIFLDARSRDKLGVNAGDTYDFDLKRTCFCGQVKWAVEGSDVRYSFPARVSLVSAALGILSVLLGILALVKSG